MNYQQIIPALLILLFSSMIEPVEASEVPQPNVEVAFVLDTTGSMGGLIAAAKEKIWAVANTLASTKPAPTIKMGLVGYRDRGDQYITKRTNLSEDLDAVYADLMKFQAGGGGDTPESVNQALNEAITKLSWSTQRNAYKVIFLVGDAPPKFYQNDVNYKDSLRLAAKNGIIVNTIQCGSIATTTPVWQEIASLGEGQFFRVEQSGGAILASTPFDTELAELNRKLDSTTIAYGSFEERAAQHAKRALSSSIAASAPASALARRAELAADESGVENFAGKNELITDIERGKTSLKDIAEEDLPAVLKPLAPPAREKLVKSKAKERKEIQQKIKVLAGKRQGYLKEQVKASGGGKDSLDHGLYQAIKKQGEKLGLSYDSGPSY